MKIMSLVAAAALAGALQTASAATSGLAINVSCAAGFGTSSAACPYLSQQSTSTDPRARLNAQDEAIDPLSGPRNSAGASAYASYGAVGAEAHAYASSASVTGTPPHTEAGSNARASATFGDTMTINAPGLAGTSGVLVAQLKLDGDLHAWDASSPLNGAVEGFRAYLETDWSFYDATVGGRLASQRFQTQASVNGPGDAWALDVPPTLTLEVPFVFGHAIYFETTLIVGSEAVIYVPQASPDDPGYAFPRIGGAEASFLHTLGWGGIGSIVDAQGHAVSGYTMSSATGVDWLSPYVAAPVPEPATAALLALGVAVLGWRRRAGAAG